jgi:hypothetical protein
VLGVLGAWYGNEDGAVEMVLGGGRVLIPSKNRGRVMAERDANKAISAVPNQIIHLWKSFQWC